MAFKEKVYKVVKKIPKGKVTTYKSIAEKLNTRAYRAVGNALGKNIDTKNIPCHRVVRTNGELGGYRYGLKDKAKLLRSEGIEINSGKVDLTKFAI